MASNRTPFDQLVDQYSPEVRAAFLAAYDRIKANVTPALLKRIVAELDRGNVEGAIDLLGIDRAAYSGLEMAIADAFNRGGIAMSADLVLRDPLGARVPISFGVRNLVAEAILRDFSAAMVTRETDATKTLIRMALAEGLARGDNPTRTALDMVGRRSRVTGKREGGYLGLSGRQERTQANARQAMLFGDVEGMRAYRQLKQRDVNFDAMVRKAERFGWDKVVSDYNKRAKTPVTALELQTRIIGRLNDRQLKYRGDVIGLHETRGALAMAKTEGVRQAIESGKVDPSFISKVWKHSGNSHPRLQHLAMNNRAVAWGERFIMADGTAIDYPHAPDCPAEHAIGCDCRIEILIDYTGMLIRKRAA